MPSFPYACDDHSWGNGEIGNADLLNRFPRGVLAGDKLGTGISGITGTQTVLKAGGGTGPDIVYGDSRIIRVSARGRTRQNASITNMTAKLLWSGSEITRYYLNDAPDGTDNEMSVWGLVYPGAPGTASATLTIERVGSGTVDAYSGFELVVEDMGSTTHLHS